MDHLKREIERSKELEQKALEECDREPIELIDEIQDFGALLAFDEDTLLIEYVSDNIHEFVGKGTNELLETSVRDLLNREDFHEVANIGSHSSTFKQREHVKMVNYNNQQIEVSLFRFDRFIVLELIRPIPVEHTLRINTHTKWVLDQLRNTNTIDELLQLAVTMLRDITGFDRVKVYKFHPDHSGEVIAESKKAAIDSFLGLRFPAFDIPPKARDLFLKLSLRYIKNAGQKGIKMVSSDKVKDPLNVSLSILRGVSPVHLQYLRNMGVTSSLSMPIVVKGKLWGLFAHHHTDEIELSSEISYVADMLAKFVSMFLQEKLESGIAKQIRDIHLQGDNFTAINQDRFQFREFWDNYAAALGGFLNADGVACQIEKEVLAHSNCPTADTILALGEKVFSRQAVHYANSLENINYGEWGDIRGILGLKIHHESPKICIYFFRKEISKKSTWAGNPKKDLGFEESKIRLHPRSSFDHYVELHKGQSEDWSMEDLLLADSILEKLKNAVLNEQATYQRLNIVIGELNHRIRNILSLVRSISKQSVKEDDSIESYIQSLESRILALARSNSILSSNPESSVDLKALIREVVLPLCPNEQGLAIEGETVKLGTKATPIMALTFNELATNAVKYGAFSNKKGVIEINWKTIDNELLISWKESNGPLVTPPTKEGFGSGIIRNAIKFELGGSTLLDFKKDGIAVTIKIPTRNIFDEDGNRFVKRSINMGDGNWRADQQTRNILVLEDDYFNAIDLKSELEELSSEVVHTFSTADEAMESLEKTTYQLALLDVNLKDGTCLKIAQWCDDKKIPFYYITGYGDSFLNNGTFPSGPVITKPFSIKKLKVVINKHFSS